MDHKGSSIGCGIFVSPAFTGQRKRRAKEKVEQEKLDIQNNERQARAEEQRLVR